MAYFTRVPNVEYQSFLTDSKSSSEYIVVKNLFKRMKLRDDLSGVLTLFNKYTIPDGSRPDLVAEEFYGFSGYDFLVLICAGITNYRDEWPLSNYQLYNYCLEKYGSEENLFSIHHYETVEIRDSEDRLIMPAGKIVNSDFQLQYSSGDYIYTTDQTQQTNQRIRFIETNITKPVTNLDYENRINERKRTIYLLRPNYVQQALLDMKRELEYSDSSEFIDQITIRTENTRVFGK